MSWSCRTLAPALLVLTMMLSSAPVLLFSGAPAWADFAAGRAAYEIGDMRAAREQWQALAEAGNSASQAALGSLYIHGEGVHIDYRKALKWTQMAAEQGDMTGQFNMGSIYASGLGVERDYGEAAYWFRLAGDQYDSVSRYNLAILYSRGLGVERDDGEAVFLLNTTAIIAGTPEIGLTELAGQAEHLALNLMMTMNQTDIQEAHDRSKEFEREYIEYYMKFYFGSKRARRNPSEGSQQDSQQEP
jgi:TPR repeat protein